MSRIHVLCNVLLYHVLPLLQPQRGLDVRGSGLRLGACIERVCVSVVGVGVRSDGGLV